MRYLSIQQYAVTYNNSGDIMYKRIRDLREDHDLTQKQVAKYSIVLNRFIQITSWGKDIPTAILIKLADYYNVTTDYILGRK